MGSWVFIRSCLHSLKNVFFFGGVRSIATGVRHASLDLFVMVFGLVVFSGALLHGSEESPICK